MRWKRNLFSTIYSLHLSSSAEIQPIRHFAIISHYLRSNNFASRLLKPQNAASPRPSIDFPQSSWLKINFRGSTKTLNYFCGWLGQRHDGNDHFITFQHCCFYPNPNSKAGMGCEEQSKTTLEKHESILVVRLNLALGLIPGTRKYSGKVKLFP